MNTITLTNTCIIITTTITTINTITTITSTSIINVISMCIIDSAAWSAPIKPGGGTWRGAHVGGGQMGSTLKGPLQKSCLVLTPCVPFRAREAGSSRRALPRCPRACLFCVFLARMRRDVRPCAALRRGAATRHPRDYPDCCLRGSPDVLEKA